MIIRFDNTQAVIEAQTEKEVEVYTTLRDQYKTMAPGARYMYTHKLYIRSKGKQGWDGKTSIMGKLPLNKLSGIFPKGLLPSVYTKLSTLIPKETIIVEDIRVAPNTISGTHNLKLRDYQQTALNSSISNTLTVRTSSGKMKRIPWPCGVLKIATGGGKTEWAVAMYQATQVPTLFLVHRKHLINQAKRRFEKYGIPVGQIGDQVFDPKPNGVTIATIQTLHSRLKKGNVKEINSFINAQQVFFDEAHLCAAKLDTGNMFIKLSDQLKHAYFRWGLTATPFMLDEYSNQLLRGATGEILYQIRNEELIKMGYLTPPRVVIIKVPAIPSPRSWPECYDSAIVLNRWRNEKIIDEMIKAPTPCIIMCNRRAHATILANIAEEKGLSRPVVAQGSTPANKRMEIVDELSAGKRKYVISTTIFNDGIDIPHLRTLILAGAGKSEIAQLQKIGRGLRLDEGKEEILVIDFHDTGCPPVTRTSKTVRERPSLLAEHSIRRRQVWKNEGFLIEEKN